MNDESRLDRREPPVANEEAGDRRPYEPPAIRRRESFETVAMGCLGNNPIDCEGADYKFS